MSRTIVTPRDISNAQNRARQMTPRQQACVIQSIARAYQRFIQQARNAKYRCKCRRNPLHRQPD